MFGFCYVSLSLKYIKCTLLLPTYEQFEETQQIMLSMKSVKINIVEGYGRRKYKRNLSDSSFFQFLPLIIWKHA